MNRVFINEHDIIEIIVDGDQTVESVQKMAQQTKKLAAKQLKTNQPALILDNLLYMGSVPPDARRHVVEEAKSFDYDKFAMVGQGTVLRLGANLLLQAIGKGGKVKYFDDYDTAIAWLKK